MVVVSLKGGKDISHQQRTIRFNHQGGKNQTSKGRSLITRIVSTSAFQSAHQKNRWPTPGMPWVQHSTRGEFNCLALEECSYLGE